MRLEAEISLENVCCHAGISKQMLTFTFQSVIFVMCTVLYYVGMSEFSPGDEYMKYVENTV
jgi:hypothetical protein